MALDVHMAASKEEADTSLPVLSIEPQEHEALLAYLRENPDSALAKLQDYYADAVFTQAELPALDARLTAMLGDFLQQKLFRIVYPLKNITEKALAQGVNLYVFAD